MAVGVVVGVEVEVEVAVDVGVVVAVEVNVGEDVFVGERVGVSVMVARITEICLESLNESHPGEMISTWTVSLMGLEGAV